MTGKPERPFRQQVGEKAERKLSARRSPQGAWAAGMGLMGLIGWSVVAPTLAGAALGIWLDNRHPGGRGWTLMLLVTGLLIGCVNAWRYLSKKGKHDD